MMPVSLDMSVSIGSSGAPTIESGSGLGIQSITRLSAGKYRLRLDDNYMKLLMVNARMQSPVGSPVVAGSLSPGSVYQIISLGTSTQANWVTAGVPEGIEAAVGVTFLCAATSSGTGTAGLLGSSGVMNVEIMGNNANMLQYSPGKGGYVDIQCMGPSFSGSALSSHSHDLKIIGGQIASTTNDVATYATNILGKEEAGNVTIAGADSATKGGVITASAGTPAGTLSMVATDPANGSKLWIQMLLSNSSVQ